MCVCGVPLQDGEIERGPRRGGVALGDLAGEPVADHREQRVQGDRPGQRGEPAEHRRAGQRAAEVAERELRGRHREKAAAAVPGGELSQAEVVEALGRVDQHVAVGAQPAERVRLVQERRVLDEQRIRLGDRLTGADRPVVDPAERHDRRAHPLRTETRERLRPPVLAERGGREQLGGGHNALAPAAVESHLEHGWPPAFADG